MNKSIVEMKLCVTMLAALMVLTALCFAASDSHAAGNSHADAQVISLNQNINGETRAVDENEHIIYDYYKFKTSPVSASYVLRLSNAGSSAIESWIEDPNYSNVFGVYSSFTVSAHQGDSEDAGTLKRNTWYYVVVGNYYINEDHHNYTLTVAAKINKPSKGLIHSTKAGTKRLKVVWSQAKRATAYQLQVKKSGGRWKTYKTTGTSKIVKRLKSGARYTVRVRGYFKYNGKTYCGKWSTPVKNIKVK